jgi:polyhydroxyalkanoate synthesis regulator phasin
MLELLKKTAYTGLGLAFMTQEKIREVARDLSQKAKLSEDEGKRFAEELNAKSKEARSQFEGQVSCVVQAVLAKMNIATAADLATLEKRLAAIEEALKAKADASSADA